VTDAFAKYRARRAAKAAAPPETHIQTYEVIYLSRGWAILMLLLWTPVVIGLIILMVLYERELNDIPYSTGMRVVAMLLLIASVIIVPLLGPTSRRRWVLFDDRIEIRERPFIPLLGRYRGARLPFGEIAVARLGEVISGMSIFEVQARDGSRFRLAPRHIGSGKQVQIDHDGFDAFIDAIRTAIERSGVPRPPGEELHTVTSGIVGVVILGTMCALLSALGLLGAFIVLSEGEPIGFQLIAFVAPFALLFWGLFVARWRKWRSGR
jgi:hypothetical protein